VGVRLRQAVLVATALEPTVAQLRSELGLGEPFADPGVGLFGLRNAVMAIGDCFLEVVSPVADGTAAGRYLERRGADGGYMLLFDVPDVKAARARAAAVGVRAVWEVDLPDISATHLHPADMGGAIVSIDQPRPTGSWRWAGPAWTGTAGVPAAGGLSGATVAVADPSAAADRWARVLGVSRGAAGGAPRLELEGGRIDFAAVPADGHDGLVELAVDVAPPFAGGRGQNTVVIGGTRFRLQAGFAG
jgi:hypothetical protein